MLIPRAEPPGGGCCRHPGRTARAGPGGAWDAGPTAGWGGAWDAGPTAGSGVRKGREGRVGEGRGLAGPISPGPLGNRVTSPMPGIAGFLMVRVPGANCLPQNDTKAISFWMLNTESNMQITWC